jgi:hypothetical protein
MLKPKEPYTIVWQECGKNSLISRRFYVPRYEGFLPFFVSGKDLEVLNNKQDLELKEEHLLKGIFYGLYDHANNPPKDWMHNAKFKDTLLYLLDVLKNGFKFDNSEAMIMDVASGIRVNNGSTASFRVLDVGVELIPESSKIKSDLIGDLWFVVCESGKSEKIFKKIIDLIPKINLSEINSYAKELVCYLGLCSLVFLAENDGIENYLINLDDEGDGWLSSYLKNYIYPHVEGDMFKNKVKEILENPKAFTPNDLIDESRTLSG